MKTGILAQEMVLPLMACVGLVSEQEIYCSILVTTMMMIIFLLNF